MNIRKLALTLAEVLIVIGIIGVVAAMTIPTLITNYQKQTTVEQLKKTYSEISQIIRRSEVDNGPVKSWDFAPTTWDVAHTQTFFDTYLKPYMVEPKFCSTGLLNTCSTAAISGFGLNYTLNNGSGFAIVLGSGTVYISIDINGSQKPNADGKDIFAFQITPTDGLSPFGYAKGLTRVRIIDNGAYKCTTVNKGMCAALIMFDGWKIADDYPW